jgi:P-aminobenzoate N-oxygenase AurF
MNAIAAVCPGQNIAVDFGKKFIPEELTPLFYIPLYRSLTAEQLLRYNQLQALYLNEQIIFFETLVGRGVMDALLRESWPDSLGDELRQFWDDERRHSEMFRQLNRRCAPDLYRASDFHFVQARFPWTALLNWATRRPRMFPMFIWLMLLQEERSLFYAKEFIRQAKEIEPNFAETHRLHLADEVGHVRWDERLLDLIWPHANPHLRWANARLLAWMVGEFFSVPKRGQWHVVQGLAREFPELQELMPACRRQWLALPNNDAYQSSLYSRQIAPRSFARFDQWPEFRAMQRAIPSYRLLPKEAM